MRAARTDELPKTEMAGIVLGLLGGLFVLVPQLDLFSGAPYTVSQTIALVMLAGLGLAGVYMGLREHPIVGFTVAGSAGLALAVVGPLIGGMMLLVGGALVFAAPHPVRQPQAPATDV